MEIFYTKADILKYVDLQRKNQKTIGFVPTMGALHAGHGSLLTKAKAENDLAICSIFVNPTQFNNPEDLKKYPRTLEADCLLLEPLGCDAVFAPSAEEMYADLPMLSLNFGTLETVMEGAFRPGHFNGVGIVVAKLFNLTKPHKAYFGLKDLQQVAVINKLVKDLDFDLEIVPCPTLREKNGLAMSSRNARLSDNGKQKAGEIYEQLIIAKEQLLNGKTIQATIEELIKHFSNDKAYQLEYFEISDFENLQKIDQMGAPGKTAMCIAIYFEGVRLIDNLVF